MKAFCLIVAVLLTMLAYIHDGPHGPNNGGWPPAESAPGWQSAPPAPDTASPGHLPGPLGLPNPPPQVALP